MRSSALAAFVVVAAAMAPSAYVAWLSRDLPHLGQDYDDAVYWALAQSIASGHGYHLSYLPGNPAQTLLPPGYPVLLSIAWRIRNGFPENAPVALWLSWLALPALLWVTDRLSIALGAGAVRRALILFILAWNPFVGFFSITLFSELTFSGMLVACVLLIIHALNSKHGGILALAAGLLGGAAYLTRNAGLVLLAAAIICFGARKLYARAALFLAGMLPLVAAWQVWIGLHAHDLGSIGYRSYLSHYSGISPGQFWNMVGANVKTMWQSAAALLALTTVPVLHGFSFVVAAAVFLAAIRHVFSVRAAHFPAAVVVVGYLAMIVLWPIPTWVRFLIPVVPVLTACAVCGSGFLYRSRVAVVILGFAAVSYIVAAWADYAHAIPEMLANRRQSLHQTREVYSWLRANCGEATVVARNAPDVYVHTGCHSIDPAVQAIDWYGQLDASRDQRMLEMARNQGDFLMVDCTQASAVPPCAFNEELWNALPLQTVMKAGTAQLFRIQRNGAVPSTASSPIDYNVRP